MTTIYKNKKLISMFLAIVMVISLVPTGILTASAATPKVYYRTHQQNIGWHGYVSNGATSGRTGQSLRIESLQVYISGMSGSILYRTHQQNAGWHGWSSNGAQNGLTGQSLRLEAVQIKLSGTISKYYDVIYRVHQQNVGWTGWYSNGQTAGRTGQSLRLEAIEIKLVAKSGTSSASSSSSSSSISPSVINTSSSKLLFPLRTSITRSSSVKTNGYYCDYRTGGSIPVYAPANGTVSFKQTYHNGKLMSYGNWIEFKSSDGVYTVKMAHLNSFNGVSLLIPSSQTKRVSASAVSGETTTVRATRTVRQGELLGYSGMTGNASGHHLHIEVYKNGKAQNPASVFTTW